MSSTHRVFLQKMQIEAGEPLRYFLEVDERGEKAPLEMNALIGSELKLRHTGELRCQACHASTRKSYGQGHCYRCFKRLARCDLCVMAPHRCHYDKGTCREPEWGESFCMQPHLVYLANSSSLKVGITREGGHLGRWRDQGALQGRILARAETRQAAGELEVQLAKSFGDRSQWRALVSSNAEPLDLDAAAEQARALVPNPGDRVRYVDAGEQTKTEQLQYPIDHWPPVTRLNFKKTDEHSGVLQGIKGQYLLFDTGVFNVREHTGYEIVIEIVEPAEKAATAGREPTAPKATSQTDLFDSQRD